MASEMDDGRESIDLPFIPESASSHDLAISNFSQVVFPDIPDFFPPDSDITVSYILTEAIEPSSRDWIGLFRVGWASPRDYSTYVWAPNSSKNSLNRVQAASFQAYQLPGDDKEFYQFCYVTRKGYVRGASTPFQFRVCTENDCLVETEDENGLIILRTKSDALEEQLTTLTKEKSSLEDTIEDMTKMKAELTEKVESMEADLASVREISKASDEKCKELESQVEELENEISKLKEQIQANNDEIANSQSALNAAEQTVMNLKRQIEESEEIMQKIIADKALSDEAHMKDLNEKVVMIMEFERNKIDLLDKVKTLELVKEQAQKQCEVSQVNHEEELKVSVKTNEDLSAKLKCCQEERNLFKVQLSESEMARQEAMINVTEMTEKLGEAQNRSKSIEECLRNKEEEIETMNEKLQQQEKKFKHETTKHQEFLRNALERGNGEKAAKQLLSKELSDTTAKMDKLMNELIKAKKEKKELVENLESNQSIVSTLQGQLETVESRLAKSEEMLMEYEKSVVMERKRAEDVEKEMHDQLVVLQDQLKDADSAVAAAASHNFSLMKKSKKSQTDAASLNLSELGETIPEEAKFVINDLKSQVTDLTTRLNMGADAYKDKFMECHKLDKKLKKMKQLLQSKQGPSTPSTPTVEPPTPTSPGRNTHSWGSTFEKFFTAITDPDSEAKEQAKQVQVKLESLQSSLDTEKAKHRKYKQLYLDEKGKSKEAQVTMTAREEGLSKALNDAEAKNKVLREDNNMLKAQLEEFMKKSHDVRMRDMMKHCGSSSDSSSFIAAEENRNEDVCFEDAMVVPMYSPAKQKGRNNKGNTKVTSSSSDSSEFEDAITGKNFRKFKICADEDDEAPVNPIPQRRKVKVISSQPIRSPPQTPEPIDWSSTSQSSVSTMHSSTRHRQTKNSRPRSNKSKKKLKA